MTTTVRAWRLGRKRLRASAAVAELTGLRIGCKPVPDTTDEPLPEQIRLVRARDLGLTPVRPAAATQAKRARLLAQASSRAFQARALAYLIERGMLDGMPEG